MGSGEARRSHVGRGSVLVLAFHPGMGFHLFSLMTHRDARSEGTRPPCCPASSISISSRWPLALTLSMDIYQTIVSTVTAEHMTEHRPLRI